MTDTPKDRSGERVAVTTDPRKVMLRTQVVTETVATDPVGAIGKLLTVGRVVWVLIALMLGGGGTGIGFLIGEGTARANFESRYTDHEKRLGALEAHAAEDRAARVQLVADIARIAGQLDAIKTLLRREH